MNLGKLLGAGKSFFGGREVVAYREDKRVYLPKFNSAKNPFEPKAAANQAPSSGVSTSTAGVVPTAGPVPVAAKLKTGMIPTFKAPKPGRSGNWTERLNPFRGPAPVVPALARPVQTELSLQAVKVLHNDLSDADVEVVPVKSRTLAVAESPRLLPGREPLEFFGERRFETA